MKMKTKTTRIVLESNETKFIGRKYVGILISSEICTTASLYSFNSCEKFFFIIQSID